MQPIENIDDTSGADHQRSAARGERCAQVGQSTGDDSEMTVSVILTGQHDVWFHHIQRHDRPGGRCRAQRGVIVHA